DEKRIDVLRPERGHRPEEGRSDLLGELGPGRGPHPEGRRHSPHEGHGADVHARIPRTAVATRSPASLVVAVPPWSYVPAPPWARTPASACSNRSACRPSRASEWRVASQPSICSTAKKVANGFTWFFPAYLGADPWTGSNIA